MTADRPMGVNSPWRVYLYGQLYTKLVWHDIEHSQNNRKTKIAAEWKRGCARVPKLMRKYICYKYPDAGYTIDVLASQFLYVRYNINEVSGVLRLPTSSPAAKIWVIHLKKMISSIGESNISTTRKLRKTESKCIQQKKQSVSQLPKYCRVFIWRIDVSEWWRALGRWRVRSLQINKRAAYIYTA